jgi:hypothetical protein
MSWIQNSGMHVAATHTDRYKVSPSRILPRQTSPLKPMHCRSCLPLPWLPYVRCIDTHIPSDVAATHANDFLFLLIFLFGNRKWQVIRTDSTLKNHQVVIPEPFSEPFTLVSYASGKKKEDHEDDEHYSAQKNPTPLLRHTECDGLYTFFINAFTALFAPLRLSLEKEKKFRNLFRNRLREHWIGTLPHPLQDLRETDRFFEASGVQLAQTHPDGQFTFRRAAFLTQLQTK